VCIPHGTLSFLEFFFFPLCPLRLFFFVSHTLSFLLRSLGWVNTSCRLFFLPSLLPQSSPQAHRLCVACTSPSLTPVSDPRMNTRPWFFHNRQEFCLAPYVKSTCPPLLVRFSFLPFFFLMTSLAHVVSVMKFLLPVSLHSLPVHPLNPILAIKVFLTWSFPFHSFSIFL